MGTLRENTERQMKTKSTSKAGRKLNKGVVISKSMRVRATASVSSGERGLPQAPPVIDMVPIKMKLARILVPIDFSEQSLKALHYAVCFAEQFGAELILQNVVQPVVYPSELGYVADEIPLLSEQALVKSAGQRIDKLAQEAVRPPLKCQTLVSVGSPFHEITSAAQERNVDLIVIATHGYTGLKHVLMGSTAEKVVRHAPCPVLTVRQREHEFVDVKSSIRSSGPSSPRQMN